MKTAVFAREASCSGAGEDTVSLTSGLPRALLPTLHVVSRVVSTPTPPPIGSKIVLSGTSSLLQHQTPESVASVREAPPKEKSGMSRPEGSPLFSSFSPQTSFLDHTNFFFLFSWPTLKSFFLSLFIIYFLTFKPLSGM